VLRLALGQAADELLLGGARISSGKLERSGFAFRDRDIEAALRRILS
jgi:NAD dependent epimerase/dehydratase family enzyme